MGQGEIYEHILYRQDGPVAFIEFNRPKVMNALNAKLIDEMTSAFDAIPSDVRVLIVRGAGDKAFAAGADLVELEERTIWTELEYGPRRALAARLEKGPVITVAALNGLALGGGFELALACHLRIASDAAELGLPELRLGLIPGNGGTIRLPRIVGTSIALQKLLLSEPRKRCAWGSSTGSCRRPSSTPRCRVLAKNWRGCRALPFVPFSTVSCKAVSCRWAVPSSLSIGGSSSASVAMTGRKA